MQQRTSARSSTDMARKYQRVELGAHVEPPSTAATQTHAKPVMQQPMQSMSELEALIDQFSIALDAAKKTVQDMEAKPKTGPDGDIDTAKASYSDMDPSKLCYEFVAIEQRSKEYDSDKIPRPLPEDTTLLTILEETNNKFVELYKHLRDNTHHVVQMFRVSVSNNNGTKWMGWIHHSIHTYTSIYTRHHAHSK